MDTLTTVYDYITQQQNVYRTVPVPITENWEWNMYDHVNLTVLYKNSTYKTGKDDNKPFKNVIRPILNLRYRSEGFDVKDISLFVDDPDNYYKSFLVKKYHEKWARENDIDTFIDEVVESFVDFGGALVKDVSQKRPEWVPFQRLAFCDMTDILSGPICEKHYFSPDQLRDMVKQGWDADAIEQVITQADAERRNSTQSQNRKVKTPGKHIEVFELHGSFPARWLTDDGAASNDEAPGTAMEGKYVPQLQIVTFYKNTNGNKNGITLFKGKETKTVYKFIACDEIYGRALGMGGAEELFEAQVWTNYDMIRMKGMLDAAAKIIFQTTDTAFAARNRSLVNVENGEILVSAPNTKVEQVATASPNLVLFERSISEWQAHAGEMGSATPALLGNAPTNHTSFAFQRLITQQAAAIHDYRRGKLATFLGEIYRDWILPYITQEIAKGTKFLTELSVEELQQVADNLVTCQANDVIKEKILNGETIDPQAVEQYKQQVKAQFMKGGNKRFMEILKGEMKDAPMEVDVSIAGKQKDLGAVGDQMMKVFQQVLANPSVLEDPRMAKIFNMILEAGGLSPIDFYLPPQPQQDQQQNKVSESISFKDLPPMGKVQLASQAGIKLAPSDFATVATTAPQPTTP